MAKPVKPPEPPEPPEPPDLRPRDKHGNVRPADERYLSSDDKKKRADYIAKVEAADKAATAEADKARADAAKDDPITGILRDAVGQALAPGKGAKRG